MRQRLVLTTLILILSSFQTKDSAKVVFDSLKATVDVKGDTLHHSGEITINTRKGDSTIIDILSTPFFTGLVGILASIVGFWFNDFLNRRNAFREAKNKLVSDFSSVLTLMIINSTQSKIKERWIAYYNAGKAFGFEPIPEEQVIREHERLDNLSLKLHELRAELNSLIIQFEVKVLKGRDREFNRLMEEFYSNRMIRFTGMDFENMDVAQLAALQPVLHRMFEEQILGAKTSQENSLNAVTDYLNNKIK